MKFTKKTKVYQTSDGACFIAHSFQKVTCQRTDVRHAFIGNILEIQGWDTTSPRIIKGWSYTLAEVPKWGMKLIGKIELP